MTEGFLCFSVHDESDAASSCLRTRTVSPSRRSNQKVVIQMFIQYLLLMHSSVLLQCDYTDVVFIHVVNELIDSTLFPSCSHAEGRYFYGLFCFKYLVLAAAHRAHHSFAGLVMHRHHVQQADCYSFPQLCCHCRPFSCGSSTLLTFIFLFFCQYIFGVR